MPWKRIGLAASRQRSLGAQQDLVITLSNLAKTQHALNLTREAAKTYREAAAVQTTLLHRNPGDLNAVSRLGDLYNNLAFVWQANDLAVADATFDMALEYQRRAFHLAPQVDVYRDTLSRTLYNAGRIALARNRMVKAAELEQERAGLWPSDSAQLRASANRMLQAANGMSQSKRERDKWVDVAERIRQRASDVSLAAVAARPVRNIKRCGECAMMRNMTRRKRQYRLEPLESRSLLSAVAFDFDRSDSAHHADAHRGSDQLSRIPLVLSRPAEHTFQTGHEFVSLELPARGVRRAVGGRLLDHSFRRSSDPEQFPRARPVRSTLSIATTALAAIVNSNELAPLTDSLPLPQAPQAEANSQPSTVRARNVSNITNEPAFLSLPNRIPNLISAAEFSQGFEGAELTGRPRVEANQALTSLIVSSSQSTNPMATERRLPFTNLDFALLSLGYMGHDTSIRDDGEASNEAERGGIIDLRNMPSLSETLPEFLPGEIWSEFPPFESVGDDNDQDAGLLDLILELSVDQDLESLEKKSQTLVDANAGSDASAANRVIEHHDDGTTEPDPEQHDWAEIESQFGGLIELKEASSPPRQSPAESFTLLDVPEISIDVLIGTARILKLEELPVESTDEEDPGLVSEPIELDTSPATSLTAAALPIWMLLRKLPSENKRRANKYSLGFKLNPYRPM